LLESYEFESSEAHPNPLPAKAACRALGLPAGQCRLPLGGAPPELDERAARVLKRLGVSTGSAGDPIAGGALA
jgi:4-hydroxy-tetrahydrodipicolinate synthase